MPERGLRPTKSQAERGGLLKVRTLRAGRGRHHHGSVLLFFVHNSSDMPTWGYLISRQPPMALCQFLL